MLYYLETHQGCGIREAKRLEQARKEALAEVGYSNFKFIRQATKEEVEWVRSMGGFMPERNTNDR